MSTMTVERTPSPATAAVEQTRVVGLALRREVLAICAVLVLGIVAIPVIQMFEIVIDGEPVTYLNPADLGFVAMLVALVAPLGVWRGESRFGESQLWTLPVDHARHARMKIAAGWLWLMAVVTAGVLAIIVMFLLIDGGALGIDVTRSLVVDPAGAAAGRADALREVSWSTPWWQWLIPFTAATATYLAATALWLGAKQPLWWVGGGWLFFLVFGLLAEGDVAWVTATFEWFYATLDTLFTGGTESLWTYVPLPTGDWTRAWSAMPGAGRWGAMTFGWIGVGLLTVWVATARHRES